MSEFDPSAAAGAAISLELERLSFDAAQEAEYARVLTIVAQLQAETHIDWTLPNALYPHFRVLGDSLDTDHCEETIDLWTAMSVDLDDDPERDEINRTLSAWALDAVYSSKIAPKLIELYKQQPGSALGEKIVNVYVHAASRNNAYHSDDRVTELLTTELPDLFAKACTDMCIKRMMNGDELEPETLDADAAKPLKVLIAAISDTARVTDYAQLGGLLKELRSVADIAGNKAAGELLYDELYRNSLLREHLLYQWGLDSAELEAIWEASYDQGKLPDGTPHPNSMKKADYIPENMRAIAELERIEPGIAKGLRRLYRIRNFARYDTEVLVHMYQNRHVRHAQNVLFAISATDHNGAFYKHHTFSKEAYFDLVKDGIGVHIIEFDEAEELEELGEGWLKARPNEKFQVVVPQVHGSDRAVESGKYTGEWAALQTTTIDAGRIRRLGALLAKLTDGDAVIPLNSCSTGRLEDGVAATLNEAADRTTTGPVEASNISDLVIHRDNGSIRAVDVAYHVAEDAGDNTWRTRPVAANTFSQ